MPTSRQSPPSAPPVPLACGKCGSELTVTRAPDVLDAAYDPFIGWQTGIPCPVCLHVRGGTYYLVRRDHLVIETNGALDDLWDPDVRPEGDADLLENLLIYLQDEQDKAAAKGQWNIPTGTADALEHAIEYARKGDVETVRASVSAWRDALAHIGIEVDDDSFNRPRPGDEVLIAYALSHGYRVRHRMRKHYQSGEMRPAWEWFATDTRGRRIKRTTLVVFAPATGLPPLHGALRPRLLEMRAAEAGPQDPGSAPGAAAPE
ncbi:MAG: hypothetical protein AB1941_00810 [Gemmatimonadota bacterium]